jgi:hypothetical protein
MTTARDTLSKLETVTIVAIESGVPTLVFPHPTVMLRAVVEDLVVRMGSARPDRGAAHSLGPIVAITFGRA